MKVQKKSYKLSIFAYSAIFFILAIINTFLAFNISDLFADEPGLNCRYAMYYRDGQPCYVCYVWEEPPYWGCIGCPWDSCDQQ
jgi:hypothetical protein